MGRDSSVGIATHYGMDGPGIESRWGGESFRFCQLSYSFLGVGRGEMIKRSERSVDNPPHTSAEV